MKKMVMRVFPLWLCWMSPFTVTHTANINTRQDHDHTHWLEQRTLISYPTLKSSGIKVISRTRAWWHIADSHSKCCGRTCLSSRLHRTNSCGCITSLLNLSCSHLNHCLFPIWMRSHVEVLSSRLSLMSYGKAHVLLREPDTVFSNNNSINPNHQQSTSGNREGSTQQRGCLCVSHGGSAGRP